MATMSKKKRNDTLSDQLRDAFARSGITRFMLAKRAGVSYAVVHRFISAERDITMGTANKLAGVLGLELRPCRSGKGR